MQLRFHPIIVERARGSKLWDPEGREYIDFVSQWGVTNIGNCHPEVIEAIKKQSDKLLFSSHLSFPNIPAIQLAERLVKITPGSFAKKTYFGLSGSDASEFVYKILPRYSKKGRFLTFYGSYHGANMGGIALSGHKALSRYVGAGNVVKAPYPYPYRCSFCKDSDCTMACMDLIEEQILPHYEDDIGAVVVEPVQSDAGDIVPPSEFLPRLQSLAKKHGMLFVDDEVKVGFGRTGKMFAIENYGGIEPDLTIMGKPIASGMPLSAVVGRAEIMDSDKTAHVFTQSGHPISCAAGLVTIDVLEREGLAERARILGESILRRLKEVAGRHDLIGEARGKGMIMGLELVKDKRTKEPALFETFAVVYRAWQLGLLVGIMGERGNVLELMPSLNIDEQDAEEAVARLERAIDDVENGRVDRESVSRFAEAKK